MRVKSSGAKNDKIITVGQKWKTVKSIISDYMQAHYLHNGCPRMSEITA